MKERFRNLGRISFTILSVGLGLAVACIFLLWWVDTTELASEGAIISGGVLTTLASLVALLVVILSAPVVSGVVGMIEGSRSTNPLIAGIGCLFGAVALIVLCAFSISQATSGGGGPEPLELLTIAGLASLASAIGGGLSAALSS